MPHLSSLLRSSLAVALIILLLAAPVTHAQKPAWLAVATATQASGSNSVIQSSAADSNGNVIVAGYFNGTVTFGTSSLTSAGLNDLFVAKWSPISNSFVWAQRFGGTAGDVATQVAVSGSSVYITGTFLSSTLAFDSTVLTNVGPAGTNDIFVAKLTDAGATASITWAQRVGGTGQEYSPCLAPSGTSLYLTGGFTNTITFGSTALASAGGRDSFLAKLADAGTSSSFAWAMRLGNANNDDLQSLAVNGTSLYLAGAFSGPLTFGTTTLNTALAGDYDAFVTKLTDNGTGADYAWALRAGGSDVDFAHALVVNGPSIYVAGEFASTIADFGSIPLANTNTSTAFSSTDAFVTKLTDLGTSASYVWAQRAGGPSSEVAWHLAVNGTALYTSGYFEETALFGSTSLTTAGLYRNLFVAKLTDSGNSSSFNWAQSAGGSTRESVSYSVVSSGSSVYVGGTTFAPATFGSISLNGPTATRIGFLASLTDATITATMPAQFGLSLALYPNPAHTSALVQLTAVPGASTATLTLRDALGRALRTETVALPHAGLRHELGLTGLSPGLYAVQVRVGGTSTTQRLIVE